MATPIGNLEDLSTRMSDVLMSADVIVYENNLRALQLLSHLGIKELISMNSGNEQRNLKRAIERLSHGESVALMSDAGTPAISDPGCYWSVLLILSVSQWQWCQVLVLLLLLWLRQACIWGVFSRISAAACIAVLEQWSAREATLVL